MTHSQLETQIQMLLRPLVEQTLDGLYDGATEVTTVADLHPYRIVVSVCDAYSEIAVFDTGTKELFAFARYGKSCRCVLYHLRFHILKDCLRDLVLMEMLSQ